MSRVIFPMNIKDHLFLDGFTNRVVQIIHFVIEYYHSSFELLLTRNHKNKPRP